MSAANNNLEPKRWVGRSFSCRQALKSLFVHRTATQRSAFSLTWKPLCTEKGEFKHWHSNVIVTAERASFILSFILSAIFNLTHTHDFILELLKYTDSTSNITTIRITSYPILSYLYRLVCFELEEFETAKKSFQICVGLQKKTKDATLIERWIRKCDLEIAGKLD